MEAVRVVVRCRPFSKREKEQGFANICQIDRTAKSVSLQAPPNKSNDDANGQKTFSFDNVFDETCTQQQVYEETAKPIVDAVMHGFNGTIFAYGQTGTGKTFSMQGVKDVPELRGIIPNAFHHIFSEIASGTEPSTSANRKYLVTVSYLEIYNEEIRDLLSRPEKGAPPGGKRGLELKEHPDKGVYVKDLSKYVVKSVEEMEQWMNLGNSNRSVGATLMNAESSRSHSIFTISVESCGAAMADGEDDQEHIVAGKLNLVDLAGSERQSKTGAAGDRLKEAAKINLSLTALGNCISALVDGKSSHIPYRDSKLTRLLQDSLGGNAKTLMIATMSPADYNFEESLSTLRYANRAKNIKNKPKINEDPKDAMLREYQEEIQRLRDMLQKRSGVGTAPIGSGAEKDKSGRKERKRRKEKTQKQFQGQGEEVEEEAEEVIVEEEEDDDDAENVKDAGPGTTSEALALAELAEQKRVEELRAEIEAERRRLQESTTMAAGEKEQLHEELNLREQQLEQERVEREALARKLNEMEGKLIVGGVSIHQHVATQREQMELQQLQLEQQQAKEQELQKQLEAKQSAQNQLEETYASLQDEVDIKSKKLQKLWAKLQAVRTEMEEMKDEFRQDREDLVDTVRQLSREIRMKEEIIEQFIPEETYQQIHGRLFYDEVEEVWGLQDWKEYHQTKDVIPSPLATPELFTQPVSLYARYKMASMDPDPRYRPINILTVKMHGPDRSTKPLLENGQVYNVLDEHYQTFLDNCIFEGGAQNAVERPASRLIPRPPTNASNNRRNPAPASSMSVGMTAPAFPTARNLIAEKKRYA